MNNLCVLKFFWALLLRLTVQAAIYACMLRNSSGGGKFVVAFDLARAPRGGARNLQPLTMDTLVRCRQTQKKEKKCVHVWFV